MNSNQNFDGKVVLQILSQNSDVHIEAGKDTIRIKYGEEVLLEKNLSELQQQNSTVSFDKLSS